MNSGFEAAVEWLAESFEEPVSFAGRCPKIGGKGKPLSDKMQIMLFQMVRELLLNIAKHAQARQGRIKIITNPERSFKIQVKDNGNGFDAGEYYAQGRMPPDSVFSASVNGYNTWGGT